MCARVRLEAHATGQTSALTDGRPPGYHRPVAQLTRKARETSMVHELFKRVRCFVVPMLVGLPLLAGGCASDKQIIGQANQFHSGLEQAVINDATLSNYLQTVGDRIISAAADLNKQGYGPEASKKENSDWMFNGSMKFHFVNSPTMNAFTTGGNH